MYSLSTLGERIATADAQRAPTTDDLAHCNETFALGRRNEVHLELDGEHLHVGGHLRPRRVTTRTVERCRNDPGVEKAMLLRQTRLDREANHNAAGRDL